MNREILTTLEDALFVLHPEAKTIYGLINTVKKLHFDNQPTEPVFIQPSNQIAIVPPQDTETTGRVVRHTPADYNLQTRILNIVKELGTFVRVGQIMDKIKEYDPEFSGIISPALTQMKLGGILRNVMPTGNRKLTYWGLIDWEWKIED